MKTFFINRLSVFSALVMAFGLSALAAAPASFAAQGNAATPNQGAQETPATLGKITVTGSAIPRTSRETPAPVTTISRDQINNSGFTSVSQVVNSLASNNSGTIPNEFTAGFANGGAGVALRGLTVNSTLVLVNGRRTAAYALADDGERSFTDLNTIPLNAVQRIEVLKDGASSLYGADAIAGVINIILYKSYNGSRATAQVGTSQKGGGTFGKATFLAGTGDLAEDNYNAYVSLSYEHAEPIFARDRGFPYSACDTTSLGIATSACVGGSAVGGSIYGVVAPATVTGTNADGSPDLLTGKQLDGTSFQPLRPCPTPITYPGTGPGTGTGCTYNQVAKYGQIAPKITRASLDGRVTVNLNDSTQVYVNAMFNQFRLESAGGPPAIQTSVPTNTNNIALPPTLPDGSLNPNDPFAAQGQYAKIGYNFGDVTPRNTTDVNHNLRLVADLNGAISADWSYDVAVTAEHTWLNVNNYGFLYYPQLLEDVTNGTYNFVNPSKNSQATRSALSPVIQKTSSTDLDALDAKVDGVLAYLPGGPLGFALGGQWRYEAQDDPNLNPGNNYQGLGSAHTIGHREVAGGYFEFNLPVVDSLEVDLSGREDHYSDFGDAFSPKAGLKWTPIRQFGVRATYSRGFRAPNFAENGSSSSLGFVTVSPPKSFQAAHPSVTGGSGPDPYAQPYGLGLQSEANPDIKPERSRNYTVGLIFQPFETLSGTVDYYNIVKTNVVAPPSPSAAEAPAFAGTALPAGISAIYDVPDPAHPNAPLRPVRLIGLYHNENELRTSGIDLNLKLNQQFGPLNWTSIFHGTDIITWAQTLQNGGPLVKFVGTHGPYNLSSGAGTPRYRANWANTFGYGPFRITGTLYFVSHEKFTIPDLLAPNVCYTSLLSASGNPLPADCQLSSFTHFDLTAAYDVNDIFTVTAGVLSLLGHKAPFDPIDYAANNYNPTYDQAGVIGRFFQVGLTARF